MASYTYNAIGAEESVSYGNGTVIRYTYDAWGKLLSVSGSNVALANLNPIRYRGYYYDTESGFYYLQSRYYDPEVCRFISPDAFISTGQGILGYNMYAYCLNDPVNLFDPSGFDPIPIWAQRLVYGTAIIEDYIEALSCDPSAWAGRARVVISQAIALAEEKFSYMISYAEHKKRGTTNPANRNKHEDAEARRQRDQGGERKNKHPSWKPNPNKRGAHNAVTDYSLGEKIWSGTIAVTATIGVMYLISNDATVIGIGDNAAIAPLIQIIWDKAEIVFA